MKVEKDDLRPLDKIMSRFTPEKVAKLMEKGRTRVLAEVKARCTLEELEEVGKQAIYQDFRDTYVKPLHGKTTH